MFAGDAGRRNPRLCRKPEPPTRGDGRRRRLAAAGADCPHRLCTLHIRYGISCKYNPVHVIKNHFFASLGHNNRSKKTSKSHYNLVISTVQGRFCKFKAIQTKKRLRSTVFQRPAAGKFLFLRRHRHRRAPRLSRTHEYDRRASVRRAPDSIDLIYNGLLPPIRTFIIRGHDVVLTSCAGMALPRKLLS